MVSLLPKTGSRPFSKVPTLINYKVHTNLYSIGGLKVCNIEFGFGYIFNISSFIQTGREFSIDSQAVLLVLLSGKFIK